MNPPNRFEGEEKMVFQRQNGIGTFQGVLFQTFQTIPFPLMHGGGRLLHESVILFDYVMFSIEP